MFSSCSPPPVRLLGPGPGLGHCIVLYVVYCPVCTAQHCTVRYCTCSTPSPSQTDLGRPRPEAQGSHQRSTASRSHMRANRDRANREPESEPRGSLQTPLQTNEKVLRQSILRYKAIEKVPCQSISHDKTIEYVLLTEDEGSVGIA